MKKDFSILLGKSSLTPKERVQIIAQNEIEQERTGKEILSEKERNALASAWEPRNNEEVRTYNKYLKRWDQCCFLRMDAQSAYLEAQIAYQELKLIGFNVLQFPIIQIVEDAIDAVEYSISHVDKKKKVSSPFPLSFIGMQLSRLKHVEKLSFVRKRQCSRENGGSGELFEIEGSIRPIIQRKIQRFIQSYERILAFYELLQGLSKVFEADLCWKIRDWIRLLKESAQDYNSMLDFALNPCLGNMSKDQAKIESREFRDKENIYIDLEKANPENQSEFMEEIYEIFADILDL